MENNHEQQQLQQGKGDDVVVIELPAPHGWTKKFFPKTGGTPRKNEIVFIAPTGEEMKSKKQLNRYLKSHPGGPSAPEFDWGTGDTPRRSARLTEKSKATETPKTETPKKKQRTSISKKRAKEAEDDTEAPEDKEVAAEDTKESASVAMEFTKDPEDHVEAEVVEEEAPGEKDAMEKSEKKDDVEVVTEETPTSEETKVNIDEMGMDELEDKKTSHETSDINEEKFGNQSLPNQGLEEHNKEAGNEQGDNETLAQGKDETPDQLSVPVEAAIPEEEAETLKDAVFVVVDAKHEQGSEDAKVGQEDDPEEETPAEKVVNAEAAQPENEILKEENQEAENSKENHSPSSKEAPHEAKVSQVSF